MRRGRIGIAHEDDVADLQKIAGVVEVTGRVHCRDCVGC